MRVELTKKVLSGTVQPLIVLGLFAMGAAGRHRILGDRDALKNWLGSLPVDLRDEVELALTLGEQEDVLGPRLETVRVISSKGEFCGEIPELSPTQAMELLARPLLVVLENWENDRDALYAFAPPDLHRVLEKAVDLGWLEFWNGGGIKGCLERAKQLADAPKSASGFRIFILTDSDAKLPMMLSDDAKTLTAALAKARTKLEWSDGSPEVRRPGHVWRRRAIENYVPWKEFGRWWEAKHPEVLAAVNRSSDKDRAALNQQDVRRIHLAAKALENAPDFVLYYMDVHAGFKGDSNPRTDPCVWKQLSQGDQNVLRLGLGKKNIRAFFKASKHLRDRDGEVTGVLNVIRSLL